MICITNEQTVDRDQTAPGLRLSGVWENSVPRASCRQYGGIESMQEADIQ
jgi:hypothetical protein